MIRRACAIGCQLVRLAAFHLGIAEHARADRPLPIAQATYLGRRLTPESSAGAAVTARRPAHRGEVDEQHAV